MTIRMVFLIFIGFLLAGCQTYSYNNQTYQSAAAALEGQHAFQEEVLRNITVLPQKSLGGAIVITPSKGTCEALGIVRKGAPSKNMIDYVATNLEREYSYFAKYLERSQLFAQVDGRVADHPQVMAGELNIRYAATIYLAMKSPTQVGWFMLLPDSDQPIQIDFDHMAAPGAARINSWNAAIARNVGLGDHK